MKNLIRCLILLFLFVNSGYDFSPESYTKPIRYDGTLPTMDAGNIGVIKRQEIKLPLDTLNLK